MCAMEMPQVTPAFKGIEGLICKLHAPALKLPILGCPLCAVGAPSTQEVAEDFRKNKI